MNSFSGVAGQAVLTARDGGAILQLHVDCDGVSDLSVLLNVAPSADAFVL